MKVSAVCAAIASFYMPVMALALGLGDMTIQSSLNQPFMVEISLLDVDNLPLSGIKVKLASYDDFERAGLARSESLDSLEFTVTKNISGKPIIRIQSTDRMEDPYVELLIDMAWATGQFYREYTVLLDPPGYSMVNTYSAPKTITMPSVKQPGVVYKPIVSEVNHHYNVTLANETTFVESQTPLTSVIPAVPALKKPPASNTLFKNLLQEVPGVEMLSEGHHGNGQQTNMAIKAEVDMVSSALETMRESNALLKEQLSTLQKNNQQLQLALSDKNKALEKLQRQVNKLMRERQAVAGQTIQHSEGGGSRLSMFLFMLLSLGAGVAGAYGLQRYQQVSDKPQVAEPQAFDELPVETPMLEGVEEVPVLDDINLEDINLEEIPIEPLAIEPEELETPQELEAPLSVDVIEPLDVPLNEEENAFLSNFDVEVETPKPDIEKEDESFLIDFEPTPKLKTETKLTKSKSALKTQIELAKTYIAMGDIVTARQSLNEIITHGDDALKDEAQKLLDEL